MYTNLFKFDSSTFLFILTTISNSFCTFYITLGFSSSSENVHSTVVEELSIEPTNISYENEHAKLIVWHIVIKIMWRIKLHHCLGWRKFDSVSSVFINETEPNNKNSQQMLKALLSTWSTLSITTQ
jgi:hypothetical protein